MCSPGMFMNVRTSRPRSAAHGWAVPYRFEEFWRDYVPTAVVQYTVAHLPCQHGLR
jgi:hypothetical protein